jgi:cell wall-associated NlpC family hydrolase
MHPDSTPPVGNSPTIRLRPQRRVRRLLVAVTAATAVVVGGTVAASPAPVAATTRGLPTNAMASVVTSSAQLALASHDEWVVSKDSAALRRFVWYRTQTAQYAATELGYSQHEMVTAWAAAPVGHQLAVLAAMTQIGVPYRRNTSKEGVGFDCSGLTTFAWGRAGVPLVPQSSSQIRNAAPLDRASAKAGDLVQYPGHVMMYLGVGDAIVHSVQTGRTVELDTINPRRSGSVRFGDPTR